MKNNNNQFLLQRIKAPQKVMESLKQIAITHQIGFAKISAIGMLQDPELGYLQNQTSYLTKKFTGEFELISLNGYIAYRPNDTVHIHLHCCFSDDHYQSYAGHLINAQAAFGVEFMLSCLSKEKVYVKQTKAGLFYLNI